MSKQVRPATAGGGVPGAEDYGSGLGASASSAPVPFVSQVPGTPVHFPTYHGRPVSWVAVTLILIGFVAGGLALVFGPTWWLFWVSLGITVVGGLLAMATGIFEDWY
jgi:hypothetical protein